MTPVMPLEIAIETIRKLARKPLCHYSAHEINDLMEAAPVVIERLGFQEFRKILQEDERGGDL